MAAQINTDAWRKYLAGLYATRNDRRSALAVALVLLKAVNSMAELRATFGGHSVTRALQEWDTRFESLQKRVVSYVDDIPCAAVSDEACDFGITGGVGTPAQQANQYAYEWSVAPMLQGKWPAEYYIGWGHPAWPDAQETATLWNQLLAIQGLHAELVDSSTHVGEWLLGAQHELSQSAPGEETTLGDYLAAGASNTVEFFKRAGNALIWGVGLVGGGFTAWLLWKAFRR